MFLTPVFRMPGERKELDEEAKAQEEEEPEEDLTGQPWVIKEDEFLLPQEETPPEQLDPEMEAVRLPLPLRVFVVWLWVAYRSSC